MAGKIAIGYFLEDRAHEKFLRSLVHRIVADMNIQERKIVEDVRSATGGDSIRQYEEFLKDNAGSACIPFDILIVASDANCKGYVERLNQLKKMAEATDYPMKDNIVFAIPDPHIERWYLLDPAAFSIAFSRKSYPDVPTYKCEKNIYKNALLKAVRDAGIKPLFGGTEYAEDIVANMDLYKAGRAESGFDHFIKDLRACLKRLA